MKSKYMLSAKIQDQDRGYSCIALSIAKATYGERTKYRKIFGPTGESHDADTVWFGPISKKLSYYRRMQRNNARVMALLFMHEIDKE